MIKFRKRRETDQIWWGKEGDYVGDVFYPKDGVHLFSFDKKKVYNLWEDYPQSLTPEEKEIFDRENPYWAEFFEDKT